MMSLHQSPARPWLLEVATIKEVDLSGSAADAPQGPKKTINNVFKID